MKESGVCLEIKRRLELLGAEVLNLQSCGKGLPDLLALFPLIPLVNNQVLYIEVKKNKKKYGESAIQQARRDTLGQKFGYLLFDHEEDPDFKKFMRFVYEKVFIQDSFPSGTT